MVKHIEAWDVEPGRVVRSLIRPSSRVPTNRCAVGCPACCMRGAMAKRFCGTAAATNVKLCACVGMNLCDFLPAQVVCQNAARSPAHGIQPFIA